MLLTESTLAHAWVTSTQFHGWKTPTPKISLPRPLPDNSNLSRRKPSPCPMSWNTEPWSLTMKLLETSKVTSILSPTQINSSQESWKLPQRTQSPLRTDSDQLWVQEMPSWTTSTDKLWTIHHTWLTSNSKKNWTTEWEVTTYSRSLLMEFTHWKMKTSHSQETSIAWELWLTTLSLNAESSATTHSNT